MNPSLKPADKIMGCLFLMATMLFGSAAMAQATGDKCASKYNSNDPIIAQYEKIANLKPLVPSKWETANTKGINFNFETANKTNQDVIVRVTSISDDQKQALIVELKTNMNMSTPSATETIDALLAQGFPFNAKLCVRGADNSLYIDLVGIGIAAGKRGKIDIKPGTNSIYVTGAIAGGTINGSVQVQR